MKYATKKTAKAAAYGAEIHCEDMDAMNTKSVKGRKLEICSKGLKGRENSRLVKVVEMQLLYFFPPKLRTAIMAQ